MRSRRFPAVLCGKTFTPGERTSKMLAKLSNAMAVSDMAKWARRRAFGASDTAARHAAGNARRVFLQPGPGR
jgi:hypothetical protein